MMISFKPTDGPNALATTGPTSVKGNRGAITRYAKPTPRMNNLETGWVFR